MNKNNLGKIAVLTRKLATDSFFECKVYNISLGGMYIECDIPFGLKERIDLNKCNIANLAKTDYLGFPSAVIKWKKDLQHSDFIYGYGIQFNESLQFIEKFITNTKEKKQSIFLPNLFEIIGFSVFLAYCILRLFSDLKLAGEPFDFFMIGCGLLGFARIIRTITKDRREDKVINIQLADSRSIWLDN